MKKFQLFLRMAGGLVFLASSAISSVVMAEVSEAVARAALAAENQPPTKEFIVRGSGGLEQYSILDRPEMVGKKVVVRFIDDAANPGGAADEIPVPQMILTKDFLDASSKQFVDTLIRESKGTNQQFQEVAGWIIYSDRQVYISKTVTSHNAFAVDNYPVLEAFDLTLQRAQATEGNSLRVVDVEFYHTHLERGEAFSSGDLDFQNRYFLKKFRKVISSGGSYASYAIPIQGQVIFRNLIRQP